MLGPDCPVFEVVKLSEIGNAQNNFFLPKRISRGGLNWRQCDKDRDLSFRPLRCAGTTAGCSDDPERPSRYSRSQKVFPPILFLYPFLRSQMRKGSANV